MKLKGDGGSMACEGGPMRRVEVETIVQEAGMDQSR